MKGNLVKEKMKLKNKKKQKIRPKLKSLSEINKARSWPFDEDRTVQKGRVDHTFSKEEWNMWAPRCQQASATHSPARISCGTSHPISRELQQLKVAIVPRRWDDPLTLEMLRRTEVRCSPPHAMPSRGMICWKKKGKAVMYFFSQWRRDTWQGCTKFSFLLSSIFWCKKKGGILVCKNKKNGNGTKKKE